MRKNVEPYKLVYKLAPTLDYLRDYVGICNNSYKITDTDHEITNLKFLRMDFDNANFWIGEAPKLERLDILTNKYQQNSFKPFLPGKPDDLTIGVDYLTIPTASKILGWFPNMSLDLIEVLDSKDGYDPFVPYSEWWFSRDYHERMIPFRFAYEMAHPHYPIFHSVPFASKEYPVDEQVRKFFNIKA